MKKNILIRIISSSLSFLLILLILSIFNYIFMQLYNINNRDNILILRGLNAILSPFSFFLYYIFGKIISNKITKIDENIKKIIKKNIKNYLLLPFVVVTSLSISGYNKNITPIIVIGFVYIFYTLSKVKKNKDIKRIIIYNLLLPTIHLCIYFSLLIIANVFIIKTLISTTF